MCVFLIYRIKEQEFSRAVFLSYAIVISEPTAIVDSVARQISSISSTCHFSVGEVMPHLQSGHSRVLGHLSAIPVCCAIHFVSIGSVQGAGWSDLSLNAGCWERFSKPLEISFASMLSLCKPGSRLRIQVQWGNNICWKSLFCMHLRYYAGSLILKWGRNMDLMPLLWKQESICNLGPFYNHISWVRKSCIIAYYVHRGVKMNPRSGLQIAGSFKKVLMVLRISVRGLWNSCFPSRGNSNPDVN